MLDANQNLRLSRTLASTTEVAQALPADKVRVVKYLQGGDTDLPGRAGLKWAHPEMKLQSTSCNGREREREGERERDIVALLFHSPCTGA